MLDKASAFPKAAEDRHSKYSRDFIKGEPSFSTNNNEVLYKTASIICKSILYKV